MKKLLMVSLFAISAAAFTFSGCKKESKDLTADNDPAAAQDNALAEGASNDIISIASEASEYGSQGSFSLSEPENSLSTGCADVSVDTITKIITVSYNGTQCFDGKIRNGKLFFDYSGSANGARFYRDPGFKCVVTSQNYTVNGHQINISNKTIVNTTPLDFPNGSHTPANTKETWHISANISIIKATGGTFTWNCERDKELLNTSDTSVYHGPNIHISWHKARIGITGTANGTTAKGQTYNVVITNQLVRDRGACAPGTPFILGTLDFTPTGKNVRHVDYGYGPTGTGQCDDWISITINGSVIYKQI